MNERIKQLADQAKLWAIDNTNFPISSHIPSGYTDKFAELILLDLIQCINDTQTANKCVFTTFDKSIADCVKGEIGKLIETNYGVKE